MLFTAYVDESDTHGPAPHMVMGANLATARQWELFKRGFRRLKQKYGFKVLHAVEFRTQTGEFAGWPWEKCKAFTDELAELQGDNITETITVNLKHSVYKEHFLDVRPKKMHPTSQYGICFEAILFNLAGALLTRGRKDRLSMVVEDGHKNASDTARVFEQYKHEFDAAGIDLFRTHTLASKEDSHPLMAMDMAVYGTARKERAIRAGTHTRRERLKPKKGQPGWTDYEITPDKLKRLIERFNVGRTYAAEQYLKRKQAYDAKRTSEGQFS